MAMQRSKVKRIEGVCVPFPLIPGLPELRKAGVQSVEHITSLCEYEAPLQKGYGIAR